MPTASVISSPAYIRSPTKYSPSSKSCPTVSMPFWQASMALGASAPPSSMTCSRSSFTVSSSSSPMAAARASKSIIVHSSYLLPNNPFLYARLYFRPPLSFMRRASQACRVPIMSWLVGSMMAESRPASSA